MVVLLGVLLALGVAVGLSLITLIIDRLAMGEWPWAGQVMAGKIKRNDLRKAMDMK